MVIDYTPHAVHFISTTHVFCSWKSVAFNLPHLFIFLPGSLPSDKHLLFSGSITPESLPDWLFRVLRTAHARMRACRWWNPRSLGLFSTHVSDHHYQFTTDIRTLLVPVANIPECPCQLSQEKTDTICFCNNHSHSFLANSTTQKQPQCFLKQSQSNLQLLDPIMQEQFVFN